MGAAQLAARNRHGGAWRRASVGNPDTRLQDVPVVHRRRRAAMRHHDPLSPAVGTSSGHPTDPGQRHRLLRRELLQGAGLVPGPFPHPARHQGHVRGERLLLDASTGAVPDRQGPPAGSPRDDDPRPGPARLLGVEARIRPRLRGPAVSRGTRPGGEAAGGRGRTDPGRSVVPELRPPTPRLRRERQIHRPHPPLPRGCRPRPAVRHGRRPVLREPGGGVCALV